MEVNRLYYSRTFTFDMNQWIESHSRLSSNSDCPLWGCYDEGKCDWIFKATSDSEGEHPWDKRFMYFLYRFRSCVNILYMLTNKCEIDCGYSEQQRNIFDGEYCLFRFFHMHLWCGLQTSIEKIQLHSLFYLVEIFWNWWDHLP